MIGGNNVITSRTDSLSSLDESLAKQLSKIHLERLSEQKLRQKIRNESVELRELGNKLRSAYVAKQQLAQIAEKRAHAYDLMTEEALQAHQLASQLGDDLIVAEEEETRRKESQMKHRRELDAQMMEQAELRRKAYEEFLHDKQMIDEVVNKIKQEDEKYVNCVFIQLFLSQREEERKSVMALCALFNKSKF
ncbi:unnamed protein product [Trichobilharzia regenti]|nr:unnamed protein product [Trichobilharzia regenti]